MTWASCGIALLVGAAVAWLWPRQPKAPVPDCIRTRLAVHATMRGAKLMQDDGGLHITIRIDMEHMERLLPYAVAAVDDGLMSIEQAAALLADECCSITERD